VPRVVGTPVERVEDLRLLRGAGRYVDDVHREGMLHAAIVRSAVPHGVLKNIDTDKAKAMRGVRGVFTAADIAKSSGGAMPTIPLRLIPLPQMVPFEQPVIAQHKVRYVGEPLAVVVADSAALAEDAIDAITVDIEPLAPVADRHASGRNEALLFEEQGTNVPITYTASKGSATVNAAYRRRETFRVQRHTAVPMETRGLLAEWNGPAAKMTVAGAAKVPFSTRRTLARCMDLPEECIDMIECDVGGGFGVRGEFYPEDFLIPFAARKLGRPVKWIEDRREHLLGTNHAREVDCELEIACEKDGTILALSGRIWVDMGAYARTSAAIPARTVAQFLAGPFRVPNIHIESSMMLTNKAPVGTYRGPGYFENTFFRERLFDMAAKDLGIDPVEFRRRNLVGEAEMPYPIASIAPVARNDQLDSGDNRITLDRCLAEIGWQKKAALQGKLVDGRYHGLGLGCFIESGAAGPKENARLEVDAGGTVSLYIGSASVGQGMETALIQIASDALDLPMDKIRIFHGSTTYLKEGFGSFHSRTVVVGGSAILDAAKNLKNAVREAAAKRFGCKASEIRVGEALAASFGGQSLALSKLGKLSAEGTYASHAHTYAYGAAAAHVAVDPKTGQVQLVDYVMVEDVGRIINPLTAHGQAIGGVVQGLGGTFLEHLAYDEHGQFLSASLADYLLPTATDFPNVRAFVLENSPSPNNPLGAKGGGDGGIVPVGGVIANAVSAALGIEVRELPLSPPRLWELIQRERHRA
jgi:carbon-monoxide dehydrogenase large subunit